MKTLLTISALFAALMASAAAYAAPYTQQAALLANDGTERNGFGISVAIDGDTMVVAAPAKDKGVAYVFERPASGWAHAKQTAKLSLADGAGADGAVAIDGDTIVIGAPGRTLTAPPVGAVEVFVKPQSGWKDAHETAELTASDGKNSDDLGRAVAISGGTVVAGAPDASVVNAGQGAAYVFEKPVDGWKNETQSAKLTASDGAEGDGLGGAVALTDDTVVAGADEHAVADNQNQGAAYVYVKPDSGWASKAQTTELAASDGAADDRLGSAVAISGDTTVVGAPGHAERRGAAYVYEQPSAGWQMKAELNQSAELTASDGVADDAFGTSAGISGRTVVVGALTHAVGADNFRGAAYVFARPGEVWVDTQELDELAASDGVAGSLFGYSVAISGGVVAAGAPFQPVDGREIQGEAYVFGVPPTVSIDSPADGASFSQGQVVEAAYSCSVPICTGSVPNGTPLDTSTAGAHAFSVEAVDSEGVGAVQTHGYTVVAPRTDVNDPPPVALAISGVRQSASKWRVRGRRRVGTTFSFRLNKTAHVALSFKRGGKNAGTVRASAKAGANKVRFKGRISAKRRLRPGRYSLRITAASASGERVVSRQLKFQIVR